MDYSKSKEVLNIEQLNIETLDLDELFLALSKAERAHATRVSLYGTLLYRAAAEANSYPEDKDLKKSYTKYVTDAFRYHDIGKTAKSLDKKFKGGSEAIATQHPTVANSIFGFMMKDYDTLSRDKKVSYYIALEAAVGHHENWNGFGYPEKKKEIGISIFARVCRIANEYDNMIVIEKNSHSDAIKKLIRGKGVKYDPVLVDVFKSIEKQILDVSIYLKDEMMPCEKYHKIYNDENISNILLGKKGRVRQGMQYNASLFESDELRPIELLYNRIVDVDALSVPFIEGFVIVNTNVEGTLFPSDYEDAARKSDRFEKLNRWSLNEVSTIHESWELKFQRDCTFLLHLASATLLNHEAVADFVNYLAMLNLDSFKVTFEISIEDLAEREDDEIIEINSAMSFLKKTYGFKFVLNGVKPLFPSYDILMDYDFDYIKVDYRLYRNYENRDRVLILIEKLFDLCKDLQTEIIFTNIREKGEALLAQQSGVSLLEGPYFGELVRIPGPNFFKVEMLE